MRSDFFWMGGMWIFPILMFVVVFAVVAPVLSSIFGRNKKLPCNRFHDNNSPLDILKERYAKGEISKDEFDQMKKDILN